MRVGGICRAREVVQFMAAGCGGRWIDVVVERRFQVRRCRDMARRRAGWFVARAVICVRSGEAAVRAARRAPLMKAVPGAAHYFHEYLLLLACCGGAGAGAVIFISARCSRACLALGVGWRMRDFVDRPLVIGLAFTRWSAV